MKRFSGIYRSSGIMIPLLSALAMHAQQSTTYHVSGTFIVPAGVTSAVVECWGGGGGGGGTAAPVSYGGGGGGGSYARDTLSVTPGTSYSVTVGTGGSGGNGTSAGFPGNNTIFGNNIVVATGGSGGKAGINGGIYGLGGAGATTGMVGAVTYTGGNGGKAPTTPASGGGGSGAMNNANGYSASGSTSYGTGAVGKSQIGTGYSGTAPGGGGSGGFRNLGAANWGGPGGLGRVKISFNCPSTGLPVPYYETLDGLGTYRDFNYGTGCIKITDNNNDGFKWAISPYASSSSPNALAIGDNGATAQDDWFFLPAFSLTGGTSYRLSFKYGGDISTIMGAIEVKYGMGDSVAAMTSTLVTLSSISGSTFNTSTTDFIPPATGIYYIGFHAYTAARKGNVGVDDISLDLTPVPLKPAPSVARADQDKIYPNPADGKVSVSWNGGDARLTIFSSSGQALLQQKIGPGVTSIDISRFAPGTYVAEIQTSGKTVYKQKLVKQ